MDSTVIVAIITGVFGLITGVLVTLIPIWHNSRPRKTNEGSGFFRDAVFKWISLSQDARKKLEQSRFIEIGGTREALMTLVESAKENDSILAICGYKGDYSKKYYAENFKKCKSVRRIFSYEAIRSEILLKHEHYALDGLKMHLDEKATEGCNVEVFLIPRGKQIKDLMSGNFDPPTSFGLAILQDGNDSPKMAIVHWEMGAEPLKHLIAIEGVVIDDGQKELLTELVKLHKSITDSNTVLTYKKASKTFISVCNELEEFWKLHQSTRERKV